MRRERKILSAWSSNPGRKYVGCASNYAICSFARCVHVDKEKLLFDRAGSISIQI